MSAPVLTFFNNKGGVGKTSLIYHLAWMFAGLGKRVLAVDLDPQTNLTAALLPEDRIAELWDSDAPGLTIYRCVEPLFETADITEPVMHRISEDLCILPGDIRLSNYEDALSAEWPLSLADKKLYRPMRILSSLRHIIDTAGQQTKADIVLADVGPNLGAINRSALIATDYVVIPLGADLFSLQGLKNLGPALEGWREGWADRLENWRKRGDVSRHPDFSLPQRDIMHPIGYLCQQPSMRLDRPVRAYDKWINRIPTAYWETVLKSPAPVLEDQPALPAGPEEDPHCLGIIRHYRSLVPMGQDKRKPIFELKPADGAIGSQADAVHRARDDFQKLARRIAGRIDMPLEGTYNSAWDDIDPGLLS